MTVWGGGQGQRQHDTEDTLRVSSAVLWTEPLLKPNPQWDGTQVWP